MGNRFKRMFTACLLIASLIAGMFPGARTAQASDAERVNVALNKTVTSSSSYENSGEGWTRSNLVDGAKSGPRLPGAMEASQLQPDNHQSYAMQLAEIEDGYAPVSTDGDYDPVFRYLNYREDFEKSELGAEWNVAGAADSSIAEDRYRLQDGLAYYAGQSFDDFKFATEVTIESGSDTSLIFRAQDADNFYQTNVSTDGWNNGQIRLYKNVNGTFTSIGEPVAFTAQAGVKMNMTLAADGDKLRFTVDDGDGPLTITATDATFAAGYIGVKAFNAAIRVEHVKVYEKQALCPIGTKRIFKSAYSGRQPKIMSMPSNTIICSRRISI